MAALEILRYINLIFAAIFMLCFSYQFIYIFIPFFKKGRTYTSNRTYRYAVLIPARNEEKVIPHLIESIKKQNYPQELVDIFVIADNCTDNTAKASKDAGAFCVLERNDKEHIGKGYALDFALQHIRQEYSENNYDGFFVFDADNLLDENYISEMNKMFSNGYRVLTSYRNTKNYGTSWVSAGGSLWYLRESAYLNEPRMLLDTTCAISGTGFLVSREIIERMDGWKFFLLTEDIEFSLEQVLADEKIGYCKTAVLYDEQPVKLTQSFRQRKRWVKGIMQVTKKYFFKTLKAIFAGKGFGCFDIVVSMMLPLLATVISSILFVGTSVLEIVVLKSVEPVLINLAKMAITSYLMFFGMGLIATVTEWRKIFAPTSKKILYMFTFPFYIFTYVLVVYVTLMQKNTGWKPIIHDQARTLDEVRNDI